MPNKTLEPTRLQGACEIATRDLLAELDDGHWTGELSASALSTATAISVLALFRHGHKSLESETFGQSDGDWMQMQLDAGISWLTAQQNGDGGWGDTDQSHSNIATTLLTIAALHLAERQSAHAEAIQRAWKYVESKGGLDGLRARYGKDKTFAVPILANCAIAGIVPWSQVSALPFELACVPQKFYRFARMPVVSYAVPALVAIGQAKYFADPPRNPFSRMVRKYSVNPSLRVLQNMQPESGGYLEAIPLTCFVAMALIDSDRSDHAVVQQALEFIKSSFREEGSWPIDTNLATWVTSLSINALGGDRLEKKTLTNDTDRVPADSFFDRCDLDWLLDCQYTETHPFTGSPPGGWGWSDLSGSVPDADDTPGALLALRHWHDHATEDQQQKIESSVMAGMEWLLNLQNRDDGWPTFCRGWGRLPFDRSGSDITAHVLRAFHAWKPFFNSERGQPRVLTARVNRAIKRGVNYLTKTQLNDGCWRPLWFGNQDRIEEDNPVYGTSKVLLALIELGIKKDRFEPTATDTRAIKKGLIWLIKNQNLASESAGSWGGSRSSIHDSQSVSNPGGVGDSAGSDWRDTSRSEPFQQSPLRGSIEESSLALDAMLIADHWIGNSMQEFAEDLKTSIELGLKWLICAVYSGKHLEPWPIGFYFAKLWYYENLYPQIYTTAALVRARQYGWQEPFE